MPTISPVINGVPTTVDVTGAQTVLSMLRDTLGLVGAKNGCSEGECGACTVLLDGKPIDSCIFPAAATDGSTIRTIEGLGSGSELTPLQDAFVNNGSVQCGFCTPGFVMTLTALLDGNPSPTRDETKLAIAGNICRCTGYTAILDAVDQVAGKTTNSEETVSGGSR